MAGETAGAGVKPVLGTASFGDPSSFWGKSNENIVSALSVLKKHNALTLDCAQVYTGSEEKLGAVAACSSFGFTIDTKWAGGYARGEGANSREHMLKTAKASLDRLAVSKVDIFYIHSPDFETPLEEMLAGVNDAYKAGIFQRFGLSNYPPDEVQRVFDVCKSNGFVLPTVYQGNYSAVARKQETLLFPLLRKLGICFYAYSPIAGGFLTKTRQQVESGEGRFSKDAMRGIYRSMYAKPSYLAALEEWGKIADEEGISKVELAYRWAVYNSVLKPEYGDAVVFGASSLEQLDQTLAFFETGPLSARAVDGIQRIWESVEHEAGVDNYQDAKARSTGYS